LAVCRELIRLRVQKSYIFAEIKKHNPMKKISFPVLDKYKYWFFVVGSLVLALICNLLVFLILDDPWSVRTFLFKTFFMWGFFYPVTFIAYEQAKKQHEEEK